MPQGVYVILLTSLYACGDDASVMADTLLLNCVAFGTCGVSPVAVSCFSVVVAVMLVARYCNVMGQGEAARIEYGGKPLYRIFVVAFAVYILQRCLLGATICSLYLVGTKQGYKYNEYVYCVFLHSVQI